VKPTQPTVSSASGDVSPGSAVPSRVWPWRSLVALFKLRVVLLLLVAAIAGAFLAAGGWPAPGALATLLVVGGLSAAGSSAINQYLERELDRRMERTRHRPLAARPGRSGRWVPYLGAAMIMVPSLAVLPFNPELAVFVLLGAAIYLGIYTMWLKPRTPLNVVIGGAAGSAAVLSGSAAVGRWNDGGALLLALLVFVWTPTHFWSLAIAYRDDYARGRFPMLPVQTSPRVAAAWVLPHTGGTALAALALAALPGLGWIYVLPATLAVLSLVALNLRLVARADRGRALALFHASNACLAVILLTICLDVVVH
jgi:protoheme IX farnesyltransferase